MAARQLNIKAEQMRFSSMHLSFIKTGLHVDTGHMMAFDPRQQEPTKQPFRTRSEVLRLSGDTGALAS